MRSLVLVLTGLLLAVGLIYLVPIPTAEAAPIFFEDDFRGCVDGTSPPPGWTRSGSTSALVDECTNLQFFPNVVNGTLPGLGPIDGDNGFRIRRSDFTCCPLGSHTSPFNIGGATSLSAGFAFRYAELGFQPIFLSDSCEDPGAFQLFVQESGMDGPGICADGDASPNQNVDSLFARDALSGSWVDTGINLVPDTWYLFRFDINLATNSYTLHMNDTLISTRNAGSANDLDTWTISTRGSRIDQNAETEVFLDWFFIDQVTVDPIADQTVSLCGSDVEQTILDASTDAGTDVVFGLTNKPDFLTIVPSTGRLLFLRLPPEGPPPVGTVAVNLTANVSTGGDFELFDLTFEACDPLGWIREFGPAWVVFLVFVGTISFLVLTLWRGAKKPPRRGKLL